MRKQFLLLSLLLLLPNIVFANAGVPVVAARSPRVLQDPKSKVIFYLESDQRHVAAISPSGKLLWICELFPVSNPLWISVSSISFWKAGDYPFKSGSSDDYISVNFVMHEYGLGGTKGIIEKKTGTVAIEPVE